ncbi:MAG TPA: hypothetical protein VN018_01190 [Brevundimonas sp.]|nr:hypothetical protein [Brevundimonas sp.]
MFKRLLAAAAVLACGACVSTYAQPADSPTVANLTYLRDPDLPGFGEVQNLVIADGPDCGHIELLGGFSPITSNFGKIGERQIRLPGDARVHLVTLTISTRGPYATLNCKNMASFTPRAGGRYTVMQRVRPTTCAIEVKDVSTGQAPADLSFHPVLPACTTNLE